MLYKENRNTKINNDDKQKTCVNLSLPLRLFRDSLVQSRGLNATT